MPILVVPLIAVVMLPAKVSTQSATITGQITDDHQVPLAGANIRLDGISPDSVHASVGSNTSGQYVIVITGTRVAGQSVVVRVRAIGYKPQTRTLKLTPGVLELNFSLATDVIELSPILGGDGVVASPVDLSGVAIAFQPVPGGSSILVTLASKKCEASMTVVEAREPTELVLYVTYLVSKHSCSGATSRATWQTSIATTSGPHEILVVVNGVVDRFQLRSGTKGLCVVAAAGPNATPLIAGPYPSKDSRAWQNKASLEMLLFPDERLPAC